MKIWKGLGIVLGLGLFVVSIFSIVKPAEAPQDVKFKAFIPVNYELRDGNFETIPAGAITVPVEDINKNFLENVSRVLVFSSKFNDGEVYYDYWLSNHDGSWFHSRQPFHLPAPKNGYSYEWRKIGKFEWEAKASLDYFAKVLCAAVGLALIILCFWTFPTVRKSS